MTKCLIASIPVGGRVETLLACLPIVPIYIVVHRGESSSVYAVVHCGEQELVAFSPEFLSSGA